MRQQHYCCYLLSKVGSNSCFREFYHCQWFATCLKPATCLHMPFHHHCIGMLHRHQTSQTIPICCRNWSATPSRHVTTFMPHCGTGIPGDWFDWSCNAAGSRYGFAGSDPDVDGQHIKGYRRPVVQQDHHALHACCSQNLPENLGGTCNASRSASDSNWPPDCSWTFSTKKGSLSPSPGALIVRAGRML